MSTLATSLRTEDARTTLWRRARGALDWDVVLEAGVGSPALDELLGETPGSFCVRVDAGGLERAVVAGARRSLAAPVPWALRLRVEQLPVDVLEGLAAEYAVLLLAPGASPAGDRFVRVHPDHLEDLLPSGRVHGQDCLLAGPLAVGPLVSAPRG
ncbi:hypothetical protein [Nocardioides sp. W7]|uniref:hypothetical protein n=1 Tax=Nocardioides sp. W7 TaxID=2931390 RepID=UPI001FD480B9|nr:hypothetical protein [Nocardioides sp. W7]